AHSNVNTLHSSPLLLKCKSSSQACPNTSLPYTLSSANLLPSSPANIPHRQSIAKLLRQYPNCRSIDTITTIAASGVRVAFAGILVGQTRRPNHTSPFTNPDVITNSQFC